MIIVDKDLAKLIEKRHIIIESIDPAFPFDPESQIGPGSIDLHLSNRFRKYKKNVSLIDLSTKGDTESFELDVGQDLVIKPGELLLATSLEIVILPPNIAGLVTGRSSIARLGLLVQCSQDYIQPGHAHLVPLQLINVTDRPICIAPYLLICQIALFCTTSSAAVPYSMRKGAKYRDELLGPQPSRIGIELGLDKPEDLRLPAESTERFKELEKEAMTWRSRVQSVEGERAKLRNRLSSVLAVVYIVLGASIGVVIQELDTVPFPSLKLLVASAFTVLSITIAAVANWRQR